MHRVLSLLIFLPVVVPTPSIGGDGAISTREDRQALFDALIAKTIQREAFSEIKNRRLGLDIMRDMRALEAEIVEAQNEEALYYALVKLSNARRDAHLRVSPIKGGLSVPDHYGVSGRTRAPNRKGRATPAIALRFAPDFSGQRPFLFVSDLGRDISQRANVGVGDRVKAVNGLSLDDYVARVRPYFAYSTENGFWMSFARDFPLKTPRLPKAFYLDKLMLEMERPNGEVYRIATSYRDASTIRWSGFGRPDFPEFKLVSKKKTIDLFRHKKKPVLLLRWRGFREDLVKDMDWLMEYAEKREYLDYHLIWDGTASGGGSFGAYALQRLSPKPFKTTFGNLRLSDVIEPFIARKERQFKSGKLSSRNAPRDYDGGQGLMDWLRHDVTQMLAAGEAYSNNVPFKLAHLPKDSDGVLQPARVHFRGSLVLLLGPRGGSHLDQFAAMVVDNKLGTAIGMPTGGFSNTWEWLEDLHFPLSGKPVARFMWSIGHTLRPNNEVLEGNPAGVDELIPMTRENYLDYHNRLVNRAVAILFP